MISEAVVLGTSFADKDYVVADNSSANSVRKLSLSQQDATHGETDLLPRYTAAYEAFKEQANAPVGGDIVIGSFNQEVVNRFDTDARFVAFATQLLAAKPDLTASHFVNIVFRIAQHDRLQHDPSYPLAYGSTEWKDFWDGVLADEQKMNWYAEMLRTKETQTTVYNRYASLALVSALFYPKGFRGVDVGCGGNYGLPGMHLQEPFTIKGDSTPQGLVSRLVSEYASRTSVLDGSWGTDQANSLTGERQVFRHSCQFYPQEIISGKMAKVLAFEDRIRKHSTIPFKEGDILKQDPVTDLGFNPDSFDIGSFLTIFYQLSPADRLAMIQRVAPLLKDDGLIHIQDFANLDQYDPHNLLFHNSWGDPYSYATFIVGPLTDWKFLEVVRWKNGRCEEVKAGYHFNEVIDLAKARGFDSSLLDTPLATS
jgi:hypothetical protein